MKKVYYVVLLFVIVLSSCSKSYLSPKQVDLVYNEVYWTSEQAAQNALSGIYFLYRGLMINGQMYERGDAATGLFNTGWNGGSPNALYLPGDFVDVNGTQKSWGSLESFADWGGFYKVIAQANLVITHVREMSNGVFAPGDKNSILGEAYFLRALTYFDIARIWGNAPMVYESIENSQQVIDSKNNTLINIPRSPDVQIMDSVLSDVQKAISLLNYGTPGSATWGIRANKGSALALAGYANMWMAFLQKRNGQSNSMYIQNAISSLEEVVNKGGYNLMSYSDSSSIQNMYKGQSSEAVFELNVSSSDGETYRVDNGGIEFLTCELPPLDSDATQNRASSIDWVPYSNKNEIYPEYPNDKRANLFFHAWDSKYNEPFSDVSATATDRNLVTWMTKFALFTVDPQRQPNEYDAYFAEANVPVFRYTGVLLLLAEAYVKNNEPVKALPIINTIRTRAGLGNYTGSDFLNEILQEETGELIGEGKLFFSYVRNDYFPVPSVMTPDRYAQQGYYWPVSSNILSSNILISQTPFWRGKTTW
ncbi:MAG: RagB/SusD family nutrient uptake outer membrane protein [Chitinophagaceae bacterium]|nr:MAG: RagB/SusD family nutrient uptake outer membrane protein [Chitinophagaceae bacterium]